jgi:hypothetical protein
LCKQCIFDWVDSKGFPWADCPKCRRKCFDDDQVHTFAYALNGREYDLAKIGNRRFNRFETFERTCADLDQHQAGNNDRDKVLLNDEAGQVIRSAWEIMLNDRLLETTSSTPHHLQMVLTPQFQCLSGHIPKITKEMATGRRMKISDIHRLLLEHLKSSISDEVEDAGGYRYLSAEEQQEFWNDSLPVGGMGVPLGFVPFV